MKFFISLSILFLTFFASANSDIVTADDNKVVTVETFIGDDRGKKGRRSKRTNKRRKRKCAQFSRRTFAG